MPKGYKGFQPEELNPMWKGDDVGYEGLHGWIKTHLKKPKECQACFKEKRLDLANISQKYFRKISDWEWLCRKCHMAKDGRRKNLIFRNKYLPHKMGFSQEVLDKLKLIASKRKRDGKGKFIK